MGNKTTILALLLLTDLLTVRAASPVPLTRPDLSAVTGIAPKYFGPNAFPVPDMLDGRIPDQPKADIAVDYFKGFLVEGATDITQDFFLGVHILLFSKRASLSDWMPVVERWHYDAAIRTARRIGSADGDIGYDSGDAYFGVNIQVLEESARRPGVTLRAISKSASGNNYCYARYYDAPGYYFDASAGKSWGAFRLAVSSGFLAWQTDNGRQNDATMYGVQLAYTLRQLLLQASWGGYIGWEDHGDRPSTLKARAAWRFGHIEPYLFFQQGLHDYPFRQYRLGAVYYH